LVAAVVIFSLLLATINYYTHIAWEWNCKCVLYSLLTFQFGDGLEELPYLLLLDGLGCIWAVSNSQWDYKERLFPESTIWWTIYLSMFLTADLLWESNMINCFVFVDLLRKQDKMMVCSIDNFFLWTLV
jgi:hypothetical protein